MTTGLTVLLALRLRSLAEAAELSRRLDLAVERVEEVLEEARADGLVVHRDGHMAGWTLTSAGRAEGERLLREQLERSGGRDRIEEGYGRFLPLNRDLLAICADWQMIRVGDSEVVNNHSDPSHDAEVLNRLDALHRCALPLLDDLTGALSRFGTYGPRLGLAHERITAGDTDWLTRSTIDSYHSVWFELHEDLLATLGRKRVDELKQ